MGRLIAFGCSNTFGQALPDVWDSKNHRHLFENGPSKYAWPQILANKLNLECVNLGNPAASVKEIWYRIVNFDFQPEDIVIVLYTVDPRSCLIFSDIISDHDIVSNEKDWKRECDYFPKSYIKSKEKILQIYSNTRQQINKYADRYFKFMYDPYDHIIDAYMRINYIDMFLKNKINKLLHYSSRDIRKFIPSYNRNLLRFKWHKVKIDSSAFPYARNNHELAIDNSHPSIKGHEVFANMVYKSLC